MNDFMISRLKSKLILRILYNNYQFYHNIIDKFSILHNNDRYMIGSVNNLIYIHEN